MAPFLPRDLGKPEPLSRMPTHGGSAARTSGAMVYEELIICGLATGWQWVL